MQRNLGIFLCIATFLLAGCGSEPFKHVQVSGTLKYEDGSLIPAELIELTFVPQAEAVDAKTHPRPGRVSVDVSTGEFSGVTTHKPRDGVVAGKHKVKITAYDASQQVSKAIPAEYTDVSTSPLEVDTANTPWNITIKRPAESAN